MGVQLSMAVFALLATTFPLFWITNEAQKEPYMDEIFHVPQAQQYCSGNFSSWDPMITTLPGLYIASLPLVKSVGLVVGWGEGCTSTMLRGVNVVACVANFYLLYLIACTLHPKHQGQSKAVLTALALSTFPVLYFFTFLYYTDAASTFFTLLSYLLTLKKSRLSAAVAGGAAILCRQTNVVWVVAFNAGVSLSPVILRWTRLDHDHNHDCDVHDRKGLSDWLVLSKTLSLIGRSVRYNPRALVDLVKEVVGVVWSYVAVGVGFVVFVAVNGGIVVGDRTNHQPCINFPQLFYFMLVSAAFCWPHLASFRQMKQAMTTSLRRPLTPILFTVVAVVIVYTFTVFHPYNLADNRHYNFYFLSKLVRRHAYARYALIPLYLGAFLLMRDCLRLRDVWWKIAFIVCTAAVLVPQRMIEFRYFIVPYLIFRLNMDPLPSSSSSTAAATTVKWRLVLEVVFYFAVNVLTVYMYVYRPFVWAGHDGFQRFMW